MRSFRWLASLLCAGVFAAVAATGAAPSAPAPIPLPAALQHRHDPIKDKHRRSDGTSTSSNWSGYAVTTSGITEVDGSWTVPALASGSCVAGNDQYSSFWVGIDGFNSNTVEQTGTDSDCVNGVPTYYAWYEFYPHPAFYAGSGLKNINPGDTITAKVVYNSRGNSFTVTISDNKVSLQKGGTFITSARMNAKRTSAEWIAEAPSGSGGVLTIANFGTVNFSNSHAGQNNGTPGTIASFFEPGCSAVSCSNIVQEITMVQGNGAGAQPGDLKTDSFTDSYVGPTSGSSKNGKR